MFRTPRTFFRESFNLCLRSRSLLLPSSRRGRRRRRRVAIFLTVHRNRNEVATTTEMAVPFEGALCAIPAPPPRLPCIAAAVSSRAINPPAKRRRGRFPHLFSRASMFLIRPSDGTGHVIRLEWEAELFCVPFPRNHSELRKKVLTIA